MSWNYHEHRDELEVSSGATVYHLEHGVLCWSEYRASVVIHHPVLFTDRTAAFRWIREGTIGQIQESLTCLDIGFKTKLIENKER